MSGTHETNRPRVLTLDIETSPMLAWTFSLFRPFIGINQIVQETRVISWAAKWYGDDRVMFRSEFHHGRGVMLRQMHELLNEADIVIHFNGDSFDVPHLRREFDQAGGFAPFSPFQTIDLYRQLKKTRYYPSNKLEYIASRLDIGHKVSHSGIDLWIDCLTDPPEDDPNRQKRAWALMRKYNKQDVVLTEDLYSEVRSWLPSHPHVGLFTEDPTVDCCDVCGSTDLESRGHAYTKLAKYPRFVCRACGKWGRSKKAVALVDARGVAS